MRKADWIAAKRAAYANGSVIGHLVEEIAAEAETVEGRRGSGDDPAHPARRQRRAQRGAPACAARARGRSWPTSRFPPPRPDRAACRSPGCCSPGAPAPAWASRRPTLVVDGETIAGASRRESSRASARPSSRSGRGTRACPWSTRTRPGAVRSPRSSPARTPVGGAGPVLLLACDLPFVTEALLGRLASWHGAGTVVPVDRDGFVQPVCARYSPAALDRARRLLADGERSLRSLLQDDDVTGSTTSTSGSWSTSIRPRMRSGGGSEPPGSLDP